MFEKIPIKKVDKWLVDSAKEIGLNIEGFKHEITNEFITHVMNEHGNEKTEKSRGNIAIKESDFNLIPEILKRPDYTIIGAKRKNEDFIVYAKKMEDGTTLYLEEVLKGRNNRTLRGKTMHKKIGNVDEKNLTAIVTMNEKTDLTGAKIVIGGGGHSPGGAVKTSSPTAAASAHPADNLDLAATGGYPGLNPTTEESGVVTDPTKTQGSFSISHKSEEKSSAEIETARKAGRVQGVCECVAAIGEDHALGKKLLTEMNVTKDMAKKYANPETYQASKYGRSHSKANFIEPFLNFNSRFFSCSVVFSLLWKKLV